jgi:flagellar hook-associated protein 2
VNSLTFSGVSKFAIDFGNILSRAVKIQSLPLQALQQSDSVVLSKRSVLGSVNLSVAGLASSLTSLGTLASSSALSASSSDNTKVSVVNAGATKPANYVVNSITSLAAAASETSTQGYADSSTSAVSATGSLSFTSGSTTYNITLAAGHNNLVGLRDAINALGAPVTASILTTGTGAQPNYLTISANSPGANTLKLADDPTGANRPLLTSANQGTNAVFQVNGVNVSQAGNVVNSVISGVSLSLNSTSATAVTVRLAPDRNSLSSALSSFASSYNNVVDQVAAQTGAAGGSLVGDVSIRQIQAALRQVSTLSAQGPVKSLSDIGLTFGSDGKISVDSSVINHLSDVQLSGAFTLIGSSASGLASVARSFDQISDPISGTLKVEQDAFAQADARIQGQINSLTDRINTFQAALFTKLSKADTEIATLASQQSLLTSSIQGLDYTLYGRNVSTIG